MLKAVLPGNAAVSRSHLIIFFVLISHTTETYMRKSKAERNGQTCPELGLI